MPETTLAPALSSNSEPNVGDAHFQATDTAAPAWHLSYLQFGRDLAIKNSTNYGMVAHYDASSIPIGAEVSKAKIEMRASSSDSTATATDIDVLALTERLNQSDSVAFESALCYDPQHGSHPSAVSQWTNGDVSTFTNPRFVAHLDFRHGIVGYAQAWTANNSAGQSLDYHWFRVARVGNVSALDTSLRANVYTATGSAGSYRKGTLVDTGVARSLTTLPATTEAAWYCEASGNFTPTHGTVYITELVLEGETHNVRSIRFRANHSASHASTENMLSLAHPGQSGDYPISAKKIQGFYQGAAWRDAGHIESASVAGSTDADQNLPAFTAGTLYALGDSDYSTDHTLSNFSSNLQAALSARSSTADWLGLRLQDFTSTASGAWRRIHSSASATATRDSLKGLLITLTWTTPAAISVTSFNGTVQVVPQIDRVQSAAVSVSVTDLDGSVNAAHQMTTTSTAAVSAQDLDGLVNASTMLSQGASTAASAASLSAVVNWIRRRVQAVVGRVTAWPLASVVRWLVPTRSVSLKGTAKSVHSSIAGEATSINAGRTGSAVSSVSLKGDSDD